MSAPRLLLRARQIKALYQRELTALHRNPGLREEQRVEQARRLWEQTATRLAELRARALADDAELDEQYAAALAPPEPPAEAREAPER